MATAWATNGTDVRSKVNVDLHQQQIRSMSNVGETSFNEQLLSPLIVATTPMDHFWAEADETKLEAQYSSDIKLQFLEHASLAEVRKICIQYRYFVHHYPNHLSTLVAKLPYGDLKSLLAQILAEELGSGKDKDAHIVWYDQFLMSIGVTRDELENSLYPENERLLQEITDKSQSERYEYLIGLCGMGGECLCQIYLTSMHRYLLKNKVFQEQEVLGNNKVVDWTFWNYHIGEEDVAHRMLVRKAINAMILTPESVQSLLAGYQRGKSIWDEFWTNNYKETTIGMPQPVEGSHVVTCIEAGKQDWTGGVVEHCKADETKKVWV